MQVVLLLWADKKIGLYCLAEKTASFCALLFFFWLPIYWIGKWNNAPSVKKKKEEIIIANILRSWLLVWVLGSVCKKLWSVLSRGVTLYANFVCPFLCTFRCFHFSFVYVVIMNVLSSLSLNELGAFTANGSFLVFRICPIPCSHRQREVYPSVIMLLRREPMAPRPFAVTC